VTVAAWKGAIEPFTVHPLWLNRRPPPARAGDGRRGQVALWTRNKHSLSVMVAWVTCTVREADLKAAADTVGHSELGMILS